MESAKHPIRAVQLPPFHAFLFSWQRFFIDRRASFFEITGSGYFIMIKKKALNHVISSIENIHKFYPLQCCKKRFMAFWILISFGTIFLFGGVLSAVSAAEAGGVADYRLGAQDVIQIKVLAGGEIQVSTELVVTGRGDINVPLVGSIRAAGLTQGELERAIRIPLERDYFVDPQVQVQIMAYHSLQYFISGAVKNPGMYELNFHPTMMDLIAKAGGVDEGRGNIAYVLRGNKSVGATDDLLAATTNTEALERDIIKREPIRVDLQKLLDQGDMTENLVLESGDTVYIPLNKALNQTYTKVYVEGEVKAPGVFDYQPGLTAFSACIMAGGFAQYAAPNRARVIRSTKAGDQQIFKINLEKVQRGDEADFPLEPGDRIFVPESWL